MVKFLSSDERNSLKRIVEIAQANSFELGVVGGIVRDTLLGVQQRLSDIDLVLEGSAEKLAYLIANDFKASLQTYPNFGTAEVHGISALGTLDLASCRKETYHTPGALPEVVLGTLEQDVMRRDFSVNAIYVKLADFINLDAKDLKLKVRDWVEGIADLESRLIRVLHKRSFLDDPTRLFRSLRYKVHIAGKVEAQTQILFDQALQAQMLTHISPQRILNEISRACEEELWCEVFIEFCNYGLFNNCNILEQAQNSNFELIMKSSPDLSAIEDRYDFVKAVLYFLCQAPLRELQFRKFSFGRKFFKRMQDFSDTKLAKMDQVKIALTESFKSNNLKIEN